VKQPPGTEIAPDARRARPAYALAIIICVGRLLIGGAAAQEITALSGNGTWGI
jgi:hypothetical protein